MPNVRTLFPAVAVMLAGLAGAPTPAHADDDCRGISRAEAIGIARTVGLVRVTEVECDDDEWEVEGRDGSGREMEVEISARTGRIKEIDYDD